LRGGLAGIAAWAWLAPALAGGPLFVVPSGGTLKPARWEGTVKVYTDQGNLGTLDNAAANQLVANTVQQWSSVPTSNFRAEIAGTLPYDITGANAARSSARNRRHQVIYDRATAPLATSWGGRWRARYRTRYLAGEGSTQIVEGWVIIRGEEDYKDFWPDYKVGEPTSGVVTHEFGHAIGLAHSQTNGFYARNQGDPDFGLPDGPEQAGPDQCGKVAPFPTAAQIETMYPMINPFPWSASYNSPQMAIVDVADDKAALSSLYPAANYAATTGTLKGRIVAKDGTSELTGINVIARRVDQGNPLDAMSRISGDLTQGLLGPDGRFTMTGLVPGASYVVYIDHLGDGGFSTPKAILLGAEEYWNMGESADATTDNACTATPITLAAGEVRRIQIAVNGIARAPTFTHIPYTLVSGLPTTARRSPVRTAISNPRFGSGTRRTGRRRSAVRDSWRRSPATGASSEVRSASRWTRLSAPPSRSAPRYGPRRQAGSRSRTPRGRVATFSIRPPSTCRMTARPPSDSRSSTARMPTRSSGRRRAAWRSAQDERERSADGPGARFSARAARANAVSGKGDLVGGGRRTPSASAGARLVGNTQTLLRDPSGNHVFGGWVGEVMAVNSAGTIAVGMNAGPLLKDAYKWTPSQGVTSLGRYPGQVCYFDWSTFQDVCEHRETVAYSVSDDGKVITGASRLISAGIDDAAIYTPKMGWMLLSDFLQRQGVLEASRWQILGAYVSADGKTLAGTAWPLAADYYHGYRLDLDQVYVCAGKGNKAKTLRVGFPDAMDQHLSQGDAVGFCPGQGPI
jgi:hypothetical protein